MVKLHSAFFASVADLVVQSVFFDISTVQGLAFTNAIQARFGQ